MKKLIIITLLLTGCTSTLKKEHSALDARFTLLIKRIEDIEKIQELEGEALVKMASLYVLVSSATLDIDKQLKEVRKKK